MKKLNFQIEVSRVLEILSNDIYDSPYALLRENIQNAYDAILMRIAEEGAEKFQPKIEVTIASTLITISDNGIGMDETVFQENFWKAGSSGKNNETAKKAGVVGTFGIGAMANFGVANTIEVTSRKLNTDITIKTFAERKNLSVTEECINFEILQENREEPGTTVKANIDADINISIQGAIDYLSPYIQYVQIPIFLNGTLISQQNYLSLYENTVGGIEYIDQFLIDSNNITCALNLTLSKSSIIKFHVTDIIYNQSKLDGDIVLVQGMGSIYGLRNFFGLAPMPVPNNFNFGGIVNLNNLHPTAGREALSRESINIVTHLINVLEEHIASKVANFDIIDNNPFFLNYIVSHGKYNLSNKIMIEVKPGQDKIKLEDVEKEFRGKKTFYYGGRDQETILAFGNENSYLYHLSRENPRRQIQTYILAHKQIEQVPDHPQIIEIIDKKELSFAEVAILLRISTVLSEDYLLADNNIQYAKISHQVPNIITIVQNTVNVYLSQESPAIKQLISTYNNAYEVFDGFIKDFIRNHLYQKFASYVPSSTRNGAEALHKILLKNRELFKYDRDDLGELDSLLSDYVSGGLDLQEVLKQSTTIRKTQTQHVAQTQVGSAEEEIPSLTDDNDLYIVDINNLEPLPAIDRTDSKTDKKILKTQKKYPHLNNYSMFLSLSDQVYRKHLDFFFEPHTTKVIWGMHRIVYIFTHASKKISFYYDIELKERLMDNTTGGIAVTTTTILTDGKIFIPIINELEAYFNIQDGYKEFFVRHDIITDFS